MGKGLNRPMTKGYVQIANKHMKMCSKWLSSGECNLKPQWDTITSKMAKMKRTDTPTRWWECGAARTLSDNVNSYNHFAKLFDSIYQY